MAGELEICNMALSLCGEPRIISMDTSTKAGRLCNLWYEPIRDEIQTDYPWRFLKKRRVLSKSTTEVPEWGYTGAWTLPGEMLKLLDVFVGDCKLRDWELEGNFILTNSDGPVQIRYVERNTDPNAWSRLMINCVAARLAVSIVEELTQSPSKFQQVVAAWERLQRKARLADSKEGLSIHLNRPDQWEAVRWGGGYPDDGIYRITP